MSDLADMLDELDFESWLDFEGIQYKLNRGKSGIQANIRECPCCGNTKWKVYFGTENGVGNCFVCEEVFGKWKFIAAHLGVSGSNVFQHIKNFVESQGWRPTSKAKEDTRNKSNLYLPESEPIPIKGRNLKYLEDRGISIPLAEHFALRYSHTGRFDYFDAQNKPAYQDYSRRVIIPIWNTAGLLVSFQGRDITGTKDKKYLFPPEFASTGSILYNACNARGKERIVIGEGVFDCIAIYAAIQSDPILSKSTGAVASFGKSLGYDQYERLKELREEGLKEVIFMWDAEAAAISSAVDAAVELRRRGFSVQIAMLPKGCDPNEVEPQVVRDAIWNAQVVTPQSAIKLKLLSRKL